MAYQFGSKIFCEIVRPKFYPIVPTKNLYLRNRSHHFMTICGIETDRANRSILNVSNFGDYFLPKFLLRGFKNGIVNHLLTSGLMSPARQYVCKCFSKLFAGKSASVGSEPSTEEGKNDENRFAPSPKRDLNEIAFKRKHDIRDPNPNYRSPLKHSSSFSWRVPPSGRPPNPKHQFVEKKPTQGETIFTDDLSIVDGSLKERFVSASKSDQISLSSEWTLRVPKKTERYNASPECAVQSVCDKNENKVSKTRSEPIAQTNKSKVSSGTGPPDVEPKSAFLPSLIMANKEKAVMSSAMARPHILGQVKNLHNVRSPYNAHPNMASRRRIHVNPETIATFNSSNRLSEIPPKFRIKRDLISVVASSAKAPVVKKRSKLPTNKKIIKAEFTRIKGDEKRRYYNEDEEPKLPVRSWSFGSKKSRSLFSQTSGKYSYKYHLDPKGTSLRQTIIVHTPSHYPISTIQNRSPKQLKSQ